MNNLELTTINGALLKAILKGATVVRIKHDRDNWNILIRLPKGKKSEMFTDNDSPVNKQYEIYTECDGTYNLMSAHRYQTERSVIKKFEQDITETRNLHYRRNQLNK